MGGVTISAFPPQELCRELHARIGRVDEERYDMGTRVSKNLAEVGHRPPSTSPTAPHHPPLPPQHPPLLSQMEELRRRVAGGRFVRPALRRVRLSADAMMAALLGSKHRVGTDLRAGLRQVRKDDAEKVSGDGRGMGRRGAFGGGRMMTSGSMESLGDTEGAWPTWKYGLKWRRGLWMGAWHMMACDHYGGVAWACRGRGFRADG